MTNGHTTGPYCEKAYMLCTRGRVVCAPFRAQKSRFESKAKFPPPWMTAPGAGAPLGTALNGNVWQITNLKLLVLLIIYNFVDIYLYVVATGLKNPLSFFLNPVFFTGGHLLVLCVLCVLTLVCHSPCDNNSYNLF